MGDVFVRNPDRTLDFVDRRKYLIKSGGENIYPAGSRMLRGSPRIHEAVVVQARSEMGRDAGRLRRAARPVADRRDVIESCRGRIAGYKIPREVHFVEDSALPRSATGKIKRHELGGSCIDGTRRRNAEANAVLSRHAARRAMEWYKGPASVRRDRLDGRRVLHAAPAGQHRRSPSRRRADTAARHGEKAVPVLHGLAVVGMAAGIWVWLSATGWTDAGCTGKLVFVVLLVIYWSMTWVAEADDGWRIPAFLGLLPRL